MKFIPGIIVLLSLSVCNCNPNANKTCNDNCEKKGNLSCKLTSPELRRRKETVIAELKKQLLEKKELDSGFAFRFPGNDAMLDTLMNFIKSERECCDFFAFQLSVNGDKSAAWLELTGPEGAKDFIRNEMGL